MKKVKYIVFVCLLSLFMVGCISPSKSSFYNEDKKIVKVDDTFSLNYANCKVNDNKYIFDAEFFEGVGTIWTFNAQEDTTVNVKYVCEVNKGAYKLVLVSPDNIVETIAEVTPENNVAGYVTKALNLKKGENKIRAVAKDECKVYVEVNVDKGQVRSFSIINN